jgi:type I restriction enzyme R subunit
LQETLFAFERTHGVVATIKGEDQSKSGELATALSGAKKIVVCTLQTFPFALAEVRRLAAAKGKRFAVIADEAHSSQTGRGGVEAQGDALPRGARRAQGRRRGEHRGCARRADERPRRRRGVTFVAFTATPKAKTLELFGTRPDPTRKPAKDNVPRPSTSTRCARPSRRASSSTC